MLLCKEQTIQKNHWEDDLSDYAPDHGVERYEVLEYWGMCDYECWWSRVLKSLQNLRELTNYRQIYGFVMVNSCVWYLIHLNLLPFLTWLRHMNLNPYSFLWCRYCRKHGRYSDTYEWVYAYGCRQCCTEW